MVRLRSLLISILAATLSPGLAGFACLQALQDKPGAAAAAPASSATPNTGNAILEQAGNAIKMTIAGGQDPAATEEGASEPDTPDDAATEAAKAAEEAAAESGAASAPPEVGTVKRGDRPMADADPAEFNARPGTDGKIEFQFRGQAWPELLEWLADVSGMSLDWRELPDDRVNLSTRRPYTLEEARDLFNRHLLIRGFTLLEHDDMLQVARVKDINPALVPRVDPARLASLPPSRFVRTSFPLDSVLAEALLPELKPVLSPNGTMTSLPTTNRLEVMDTAGNLVEIAAILSESQSPEALGRRSREFRLVYVRAVTVRDQLLSIFGGKVPFDKLTPEQIQQVIQQQHELETQRLAADVAAQQAAQAALAAGQPAAPPIPRRNDNVTITLNERRNSLLVQAPPDKMALVENFVQQVDVPAGAGGFNAVRTRVQVYRPTSLDPQKFIDALLDLDALEPDARLTVDKDNNAVIASASIADHYVIGQMLERMDGSARQFDVIQLRRLRADEVAGTIKFLMGVKEEKTENRRRYWWSDEEQNKKKDDQFRVGANVRDNQVLIWANQIEREEINKLLVKMGELPGEGGTASNYRTISASRTRETLEYLRRIERMWQQGETTPLILPSGDDLPADDDGDESPAPELPGGEGNGPPGGPSDSALGPGTFSLGPESPDPGPAQDPQDSPPSGQVSGAGSGARPRGGRSRPEDQPVRITFDSRGNLVLQSENQAALDRLERMMTDFAPPRREFDVFRVRHADAWWVRSSLENYFKDRTGKKDDGRNAFISWLYDDIYPEKDKQPDAALGNRSPLKFISDTETKTIIVLGADDADRETIRELIRVWDVPLPPKQTNVRRTQLVRVRFSRAETIVNTVKEVYRDLLSATDSTFQQPSGEEKKGSGDGPPPVRPVSFSGNLSLGVDQVTNTIVVSSTGSQSEAIMQMALELIRALDEGARPNSVVEVVRMDFGGRTQTVQRALEILLRSKADEAARQQNQQQGQEQQQQDQQKAAEEAARQAQGKNENSNTGNPGNRPDAEDR